MGQIDDISASIYHTEFYDEDGDGAFERLTARISAWLETNIGQLNILINTSFRIDENNDVHPRLLDEEIAIFIQLYLKAYYKRQSQNILKNATTSELNIGDSTFSMSGWTELREGDSVIKRVSQNSTPQQKIQAAESYQSFSTEADIKLGELVHAYNMYNARPRQVITEDTFEGTCELEDNHKAESTEQVNIPITPSASPTPGNGTVDPVYPGGDVQSEEEKQEEGKEEQEEKKDGDFHDLFNIHGD